MLGPFLLLTLFNNTNNRWTPGKVVKIWDEGNPYHVELQDKLGSNV